MVMYRNWSRGSPLSSLTVCMLSTACRQMRITNWNPIGRAISWPEIVLDVTTLMAENRGIRRESKEKVKVILRLNK